MYTRKRLRQRNQTYGPFADSRHFVQNIWYSEYKRDVTESVNLKKISIIFQIV